MTDETIATFECPSSRKVGPEDITAMVSATSKVDVLLLTKHRGLSLSSDVVDLADLKFAKSKEGSLVIKHNYRNLVAPCNLDLKNFDPEIDLIRTRQGDYTTSEILAHGHNAPFYKQARINAEVAKSRSPGK